MVRRFLAGVAKGIGEGLAEQARLQWQAALNQLSERSKFRQAVALEGVKSEQKRQEMAFEDQLQRERIDLQFKNQEKLMKLGSKLRIGEILTRAEANARYGRSSRDDEGEATPPATPSAKAPDTLPATVVGNAMTVARTKATDPMGRIDTGEYQWQLYNMGLDELGRTITPAPLNNMGQDWAHGRVYALNNKYVRRIGNRIEYFNPKTKRWEMVPPKGQKTQ